MHRKSGAVTDLIRRTQEGDSEAQSELYNAVYLELKQIARKKILGQKHVDSLPPTALVNETYLKLRQNNIQFKDRKHFFAVAAQCMRWIVLEYARNRGTEKRGGKHPTINFNEQMHIEQWNGIDLGMLSGTLDRLKETDERLLQVVELRYFVGLSVEETAEVMETSVSTVKRDSELAKAWIQKELDRN